MAAPDIVWKNGKFGRTSRRDSWWLSPVAILVGLSAFLVYANWAAFQNAHYTFGPYISPFYSPELFGSSPHALFGPKPGWYPDFLPFSPALLILWIPGLFRFTCYYYRGAYYKAFWADPPALRCRRAATVVPGRAVVPARSSERAPELPAALLSGVGFSGLRCR